MASQIYSRYVPPTKKKTVAVSQSALELPIPQLYTKPSTTTPPPTRHDASSTYTRYIPPSKPKPTHTSPPIASVIEVVTSDLLTKRKRDELAQPPQEPESKKVKKSRKNKTSTVKAPDPQKASDIVPLSAGNHEETMAESKPRKKIRKHIDERADTGGDGIDMVGDSEDIKHKNVLKKRQKSIHKAAIRQAAEEAAGLREEKSLAPEQPIEFHDLGPLPQPAPVPEVPIQSTLSSLPSWFQSPQRVSPSATAAFSDLGIREDVARILQSKGFKEAFAIQAAVLPLFLPGKYQQPGDIVVSAATGSGKTLAYVLPMVEDISHSAVTRLRGLIVMPTRELVTQAREVCEVCVTAFSVGSKRRVKVGTAVGNEAFAAEQAALMDQNLRYDPARYEQEQRKLNAKWESSDIESDGEDEVLYQDESLSGLPDHIVDPVPKIDILICTPGRLVEHLKSTPGFSLSEIKWLVVDEADRLLDQSFQQWLNIVMANLTARIPGMSQDGLRSQNRVRKVILSATMTQDIGQLSSLNLHRPRLIVLEGRSSSEDVPTGGIFQTHNLPALLVESAVKVHEETMKPLYLMALLKTNDIVPESAQSSSTSTSSDLSSSSEDESSDDEASSSDDTSSTTSIGSSAKAKKSAQITKHIKDSPRGVLIFTKSNEAAIRLSRLIALLEPGYASMIGTLTSTTRSSARKASLNSFNTGRLSILIASDLVSRGLDLPNLAHVINYDIPTSVTSYVHRVGRTARAGKRGHAWTLLSDTEARWFWNEIARSNTIGRLGGSKVARVNIDSASFDSEERNRYEIALEVLGREASGLKS